MINRNPNFHDAELLQELRKLSELYAFDLFEFLRHLSQADAPVLCAEVNNSTAIATDGRVIH